MANLKRVVIATSNKGKFREMMEVLGDLPCRFLSLDELGLSADCEENADTFEGNALQKAHYYFEKSGLVTLAEDSGIMVDALSGELGVKTRRWGAGEKASDEEWIKYFLERMKNVPLQERGAKFVCCSAIIDLDGGEHLFRGETAGRITEGLEAPIYAGLPLSSCFRPDGFDKVYSALTIEEKNRTSHRGKAMRQVHEWLGKYEE
jgi:XTP/dITP diphosphohydrolase